MNNSNSNALGILFPNMFDKVVPELTNERLMASVPFASRYRMVDFLLSSMVNCGIDNIAVIVRENYFSLLDHISGGREWDLARKNGGLTIFPPYAEKTIGGKFGGKVVALYSILRFLKSQKEEYVFLSDTNIAINYDFNAMLAAHKESGADVTVAYTVEAIPEVALKADDISKAQYYTYDVAEDGIVTKIYINPKEAGVKNFGLNIYCVGREWLINAIQDAYVSGGVYFERDVIFRKLEAGAKVGGYKYDGYAARISDLKSYFDENMKLLDDENLDALFSGNQIYTKIRDDNPTRYISGAKAENAMVADGCVIEGDVENCILFRGVKIAKGAVVKNCILMQDTVVEAGANLDHIITDKKVVIGAGKELKGSDSFPVFVGKYQTV